MRSILSVTTPASSYDLTILETVKNELKIDMNDGSKDEDLAIFIHQASDAIAGVCKRVFAEEVISETIRREPGEGEGFSKVILQYNRRPVTVVNSVVEDDITLVEGTDYEVDYNRGVVHRLAPSLNPCVWYFYDKIVISYTAGYYLLDDLPYDIEKACLKLIGYFYDDKFGGKTVDGNLRIVDIPGVIRREWDPKVDVFRANLSQPPAFPSDVMVLLSRYIISAWR